VTTLSSFSRWLERRRHWGVLFIRLAFGAWLVYGTQDNVFDRERMIEFQQFIARNGFPWPVAGAYLSAYAQFICGFLYIAGAALRPAAAVTAINFLFAIGIAHRNTFLQNGWPALGMLVVALFLLFNGAGPLSVDAALARRRK
jgi:uncharacterized membrane protein YphA (DoxX/SURF4 family)